MYLHLPLKITDVRANIFLMNTSGLQNTDRLFGIAAFLISLGTFSVYIYEARLLQKQQYASALPYLELWNSGSNEDYKLLLVNNGIGPAFIQEVKIHYGGKVYAMDHDTFFRRVIAPTDTIQYTSTNLSPGRVIPAGQTMELFSVDNAPEVRNKLRRLFGDEQAQLEIVYASVYEERWRLKGMEDPPRKLDD